MCYIHNKCLCGESPAKKGQYCPLKPNGSLLVLMRHRGDIRKIVNFRLNFISTAEILSTQLMLLIHTSDKLGVLYSYKSLS